VLKTIVRSLACLIFSAPFQFKESATAEQIAEMEEAFAELLKKIDTIHSYEWGTKVVLRGKTTVTPTASSSLSGSA